MITILPPPDDAFQELRIPAGGRWARPYWFSYGPRNRLALRFTFSDSCRYTLPGAEQLDWLKLCGVSFDWWTNHRDSGMISCRYNPDMDAVELGVYTHRGGQWQAWFDPRKEGLELPRREAEVFARVGIGGPVECLIDVDRNRGHLDFEIATPDGGGGRRVSYDRQIPKWLRVINPWFGGTLPAPHDAYLFRQSISNDS